MIEPGVTDDKTVDALIGEIAEDFTQRALAGEQPVVEDYVRRYPAQADVLRQLLPALLAIRPLGEDGALATIAAGHEHAANSLLGDYRIVREIGRGGMGVVYEAEQLSLRRRVALKVLPLAAVLDEKQLQRFKNEALAAAQLDHPHIVDVLGIGCDRGVHYHAMRYIEGQTLAEVIDATRGLNERQLTASSGSESLTVSDPFGNTAILDTVPIAAFSTEGPPAKASRFRSAAEICRQIAEALDHAHENGIVHRDVKPSNLIIDGKGKAWVCDFGLAHIANNTAELTQTGDMIGTLRFMSPEQVTARRVVMDHRIDVYALGATLYELVTLRPAHDGATREELLRQIISQEPKSPRKVDPDIPGELETIVLKAIAKAPDERYATAGEFAEDLQRFLDDKPIRAKRPTLRQRLSRWSRHHQAFVRSAAAMGVIALVGLLVAGICIEFARRDAVDAWIQADSHALQADREREEAERLRVLEEQNFRRAMRAVDLMLTRVAEKNLVNVPGMIELRRELLVEALAIYQQFLKQRHNDSKVRFKTVKAYERVGKIQLMMGRRDAAERAFLRVIEIAAAIPRDHSERDKFRLESAAAHHNLGMIRYNRGQNTLAEKAYRESLRIGRELSKGQRQQVAIRKMRGASHNNLGNVVYQRGERKQAGEHYRLAIAEYESLVKESPATPSFRQVLATVHCSLARLLTASRMTTEDEEHYRRAFEIQSRLVKEYPTNPAYQRELARTLTLLGIAYRRAGKFNESSRYFQRAIEMQQKLFEGCSAVPSFLGEVARTHSNYSLLLKKTGPLELSARHSRKALEWRRKLADSFPDKPSYRLEIASSHRILAAIFSRMSKPEESHRQLEQSHNVLDALVANSETVPQFRIELAETLLELGRSHARRREYQLSETHLTRAVELIGPHAAKSSAAPKHRAILGELKLLRGILMSFQTKRQQAATQFHQATEVFEKLVAEFPAVESYRRQLARTLHYLAMTYLQMQRISDAEVPFRKSLKAYASLMRVEVAARRYRSRFVEVATAFGQLLRARRRNQPDGCELLIMAISAWTTDEAGQSKTWFDRAVATRGVQLETDPLFQRLLAEAELLTGFKSPKTRKPAKARRPRQSRAAPLKQAAHNQSR